VEEPAKLTFGGREGLLDTVISYILFFSLSLTFLKKIKKENQPMVVVVLLQFVLLLFISQSPAVKA
jgi:hypothetical protein